MDTLRRVFMASMQTGVLCKNYFENGIKEKLLRL
jgi:hypothetical protein